MSEARVMRRNAIERVLSQVPPHPSPQAALEQYATPAPIATDVLFEAFHLGDIGGEFVMDMGCGTGVLAIGAGLLGAMPVFAFDVDPEAVAVAEKAAQAAGVSQLEFDVMDVAEAGAFEVDTVLSNPPFGAQKRHADRPFLEAAAQAGRVVWTFHLLETRDWVERRIAELGGTVTHALPFHFPLKAQFFFHDKPVREVDVVVLRWETGRV